MPCQLVLRANEPFSAWILDARFLIVMANLPFDEAQTSQWETPVEDYAHIPGNSSGGEALREE